MHHDSLLARVPISFVLALAFAGSGIGCAPKPPKEDRAVSTSRMCGEDDGSGDDGSGDDGSGDDGSGDDSGGDDSGGDDSGGDDSGGDVGMMNTGFGQCGPGSGPRQDPPGRGRGQDEPPSRGRGQDEPPGGGGDAPPGGNGNGNGPVGGGALQDRAREEDPICRTFANGCRADR